MTAEIGVEKRGTTPNFIRELFREDALVAREILMEILVGGVHLTGAAAQTLNNRSPSSLGCTLTSPLQVPTITERLNAAKLILQTGVGFKIDHTSGDEAIRAQVVLMPPWDDDPQLKDSPVKGALTDGQPDGNGNGNGKR